MSNFEVAEPILNSPYAEPAEHWYLEEGEEPKRLPGRRAAGYFYRDPREQLTDPNHPARGVWVELQLVNLIRQRVKDWRAQGWPGVTRTTLELLEYWQRDGRDKRLFFAQLEAAEAIIFLMEARSDFLQGVTVPMDEPSDDRKADGFAAFRRYACKMATGAGKTTVMGMLAAWSILNKINSRGDARFSDIVLIVCPNVTIRSRLGELKPEHGEASLYRTRDLVPSHLMSQLTHGRVLVTNWHVFEPQTQQVGGVSARVSKAGRAVPVREWIRIGPKKTTARGSRYLTPEDFERQRVNGMLAVLEEERDIDGTLKKVRVESTKYVQSDTSVVNKILGREVGGKQNILVMNDEAHHAYRIRRDEPDEGEDEVIDEEEAEEFIKEATVWVEGLDRFHKLRGINFCIDLSATPYYLARVGQDTNRTFPWVVSDFGLTDAIESGLVKIPQLALRDTSGEERSCYFNIWQWLVKQLTTTERGAKKAGVKPEAVLKYAHTPIALLGGDWGIDFEQWEREKKDPRPPVFIIVCKNTRIARLIYEWLAENNPPTAVPPAGIEGFLNRDDRQVTIRVDSKVVHETDSGEAKSNESRWMRLTLDTVGKTHWPTDRQGREIYPQGFEELAKKLERPLHPPGRDIRCIVSVGMLTEGWDCSTVTHIIGLRPFMSQLLCEQVVGRGLRRTSYEVGGDGKLEEEVAKVLGVPFEIIPFKESKRDPKPRPKRNHVHAVPEKAQYEIRFPRVEGYQQAIRNRIEVNWSAVAPLCIDPGQIPPEAELKAGLPNNEGRHSLVGPGKLDRIDLNPYRIGRRMQELVFEMAAALTRDYAKQSSCEAPAHVLFPQIEKIVDRFVRERVRPLPPAEAVDVFLSPYYGWVIERLVSAIRPDASQGEAPELPRYESNREPGSTAEVDFHTSRDVRPVVHSHVNYVVADTARWEQSAAYYIDTHPNTAAFVKNAGLGFAIPYLFNDQPHDYIPDFIIRLTQSPSPDGRGARGEGDRYLILETKGYDPLRDIKTQAAHRWRDAINADARFGCWSYDVVNSVTDVPAALARVSPLS